MKKKPQMPTWKLASSGSFNRKTKTKKKQ